MSEDGEYHADYPTVPIGGGNPYAQCAHCGRSVPEINGRLEGHAPECRYRVGKETARAVADMDRLTERLRETNRRHAGLDLPRAAATDAGNGRKR